MSASKADVRIRLVNMVTPRNKAVCTPYCECVPYVNERSILLIGDAYTERRNGWIGCAELGRFVGRQSVARLVLE
jgi:hypothetical protein